MVTLAETASPSKSGNSSGWAAAVILVLATAVVAPLFFLGNASGHDFQFHLASWMDVSGQWREGVLYPRWAEWANWGFGEPRFVFYPPASWMLGALLGVLMPWRMVPGTYIWVALVVAGFSMWTLAREWLAPPQAIAAAALYMVNPYHLVIVYYRSDFAELLAGALLPMLLWSAFQVAREGWRCCPLLAIVFAAIWLTNAPEAVIATYALSLALVVVSAVRRSFRSLLMGAVAMCAGFGLAAFYILPAAYERRWVQIGQAVSDNLQPARNFLFTQANDPEFVLFNWKVSWVALALVLVSAIAAVLSARRRRDYREPWWVLLMLGVASVALMVRPSLLFWRLLPNLAFVQFPWRWLEVLSVGFAFFIGAAWSPSRRPWTSSLATFAVFAAIAVAGAAMVEDAWWDSENAPVLLAAIRSAQGYEGTDEYQPNGADRSELPGNPDPTTRADDASATPAAPVEEVDASSATATPVAGGTVVHIERWSAKRKSFNVESARPVTLALRLLSYPAWQARVDGGEARLGAQPGTARLLLDLPAGTHLVEIRFRRTWDRTVGNAISAFSCVALLALGYGVRRRRWLGGQVGPSA
jgi:uncharacterized membrane protein YhaH (DUF805 family)